MTNIFDCHIFSRLSYEAETKNMANPKKIYT